MPDDHDHASNATLPKRPNEALEKLDSTTRDFLAAAGADNCEIEDLLDHFPETRDALHSECREQVDEIARLLANDPVTRDTAGKLARDASLSTRLSDDRMTLFLVVEPAVGGGRSIELPQVIEHLQQQGVAGSVDRGAIVGALRSDDRLPRAIVHGRSPVNGADGQLHLFARLQLDAGLVEIHPEQWQDRQVTLFCKAGDVILRRQPAGAGSAGQTADGRSIPPVAGQDPELRIGANVEQIDESVIARAAGVVVFDGAFLEVRRVLVVDGDVAPNQAVQFDGEVLVRGTVRQAATIRATGDIRVRGTAEAARIESTGGDVILERGVAGRGRAQVRAKGSIITRFAEHATLVAGDDIVIESSTLHAHLIAGRAVLAERRRGQIISGVTTAGEAVRVKRLGADSGVATKVICGLSRSVIESLDRIADRIARLADQRDRAEALADRIKLMAGDVEALAADVREDYIRLRKLQLSCHAQIRLLDNERNDALARSAREVRGRIEAAHTIHRGVVARLGMAEMTFEDPRHRCAVRLDETGRTLLIEPSS